MMKTYLFSEWTVATSDGSIGRATVFLSAEGEAYMLLTAGKGTRFFRVEAELLSKGAKHFFRNVMKTAVEVPISEAVKMGLLQQSPV